MDTSLYEIKRDYNARVDIRASEREQCKVVLKRTGKVAFYGTRSECKEWIERNDGDEWN